MSAGQPRTLEGIRIIVVDMRRVHDTELRKNGLILNNLSSYIDFKSNVTIFGIQIDRIDHKPR